jgi:hypothetical protein
MHGGIASTLMVDVMGTLLTGNNNEKGGAVECGHGGGEAGDFFSEDRTDLVRCRRREGRAEVLDEGVD